ncbi:MAG: SET domain-containing protein [Ignavibacteria bacterium]|nr:SET domain-containing protein [Ignavibacteria bacterium]
MKQHTIKESARCAHKSAKGRCKRITVITHPYCSQHTVENLGVKVAKSNIQGAGYGLFAARNFGMGDRIVEYKGEIMTQEEYDSRYAENNMGAYGLELNDTHVIDAARITSGVARYACTYHGSGRRKPNAEYVSDDEQVWIVSLNRIKSGDEIFTDYGEEMLVAMGLR